MNGNVELATQLKCMLAGFIATAMLMLAVPAFAQVAPAAPQGGFSGGVRVATGDINGDGTGGLVTGSGTDPHPDRRTQPARAAGPQVVAINPNASETGSTPRALNQTRGGNPSSSGQLASPAGEESAALLLPAVQSAREAARR